MKKTLIQLNNMDEFICKASPRIFIDGTTMILTPGAKDALTKRGVKVIHGTCPDAAGCTLHGNAGADGCDVQGTTCDPGLEKLFYGVASVLKNEYGVTDLAKLRALSLKAVEIIQKNI